MSNFAKTVKGDLSRMTTKDRKRTTIELNEGDKEKLIELAAAFDIIQTRGSDKGRGSVSGLMQAIASGRVKIEEAE